MSELPGCKLLEEGESWGLQTFTEMDILARRSLGLQ